MPAGDSSTPTQVCTKCGEIKPLGEFDLRLGRPLRRCKACVLIYRREWAAANRDHLNAKAREYAAENRDEINERKRARAKTPEGRAYGRLAGRRWYDKKRDWLEEQKAGKPCVDCGRIYPPYVLDFDHVRGEKLFNIADWIGGSVGGPVHVVLEEIAKCDLRCANCHRIRHREQLRPARRPSEEWNGGQMKLVP